MTAPNSEPDTHLHASHQRHTPLSLGWLPWLIWGVVLIAVAAIPLLGLGATPPDLGSGSSVSLALPIASPVPGTSPWLLLISVGVPIVVNLVKSLIPRLGKVWLPIIAASIGLVLAILDHFTGLLGGNPIAIVLLGAAGTGLREVADQLNQAIKSGPGNGAPTVAPAVTAVLVVGLMIGACGFAGCAGQSPERISLTSAQVGLDTIDIASQAYERDLVAREVRDGKAKYAVERQTYIDTYNKFQDASKAAINAWAAIHGTDGPSPTASQLADVSAEFAAAEAGLLQLISPFLRPAGTAFSPK